MRSGNKKPSLSVLISAYNAEKYIEQAINSVLEQTYSDFELIIADDGSSDNTKKIINETSQDPRIIISHNEKNYGKTETINRLCLMSRGKFLTIHDADDFSEENRFEEQMNMFLENPQLGMSGVSFREIINDNTIFNTLIQPDNYDDVRKQITSRAVFHGPTMIFKKELLDDSQVYRPYFNSYKEDCDLAYRLSEKAECYNTKEVLYNYRILPGSLSKTLNIQKQITYKLIVEFATQRETTGKDFITEGNLEGIQKLEKKLKEPYLLDKTQILIETAEFHMYYKLYPSAIQNSFKAVLLDPFRIRNIRTLLYCIRKAIVRS